MFDSQAHPAMMPAVSYEQSVMSRHVVPEPGSTNPPQPILFPSNPASIPNEVGMSTLFRGLCHKKVSVFSSLTERKTHGAGNADV